jgi:hypothetical protein
MGIFNRFKRRTEEDMSKKNKVKTQPVHKVEEVKLEEIIKEEVTPVEEVEEVAVQAPAEEPVQEVAEETATASSLEDGYDQLDLAIAKLLGTYTGVEAPKPYSTDRNFVMDMVTFARENKIKLPRFTSDPMRIAKAIVGEK